jgi:hypothetical protein
MSASAKTSGVATIALALGFNIPFAILGSTFDYPDILRQPAAMILERFHAGGAGLVLTWYAFMLSAILMVPVAAALAVQLREVRDLATLRSIAFASGAAAGILQAIGLSRWVFVVPGIARIQADPASTEVARAQAQASFDLLNSWGGVAIGEHLGQIFTVLFVASLASAQLASASRLAKSAGVAGVLAALLIAVGLGEGLALATGNAPGMLGLFTVVGYLAFTLWLILTGATLLRDEARGSSFRPATA